MKSKLMIIGCFLTFLASSCTKNTLSLSTLPAPVRVPSDWHVLPEDATQGSAGSSPTASEPVSDPTNQKDLGKTVDKIFAANQKTIEKLPEPEGKRSFIDSPKPKDWTPWHLEYFTTDLAVSAQGLIGVLTVKGTPVVQAFWRKKRPAPEPTPTPTPSVTPTSEKIHEDAHEAVSKEELASQIEPSVQAAIATGQVKDGPTLKQSLTSAASQFQEMVRVLENQGSEPGSEWWVSGFRLDFLVSASGKLIPIGTLGGELRLRYEWKRMKKKTLAPGFSDHNLAKRLSPLSESLRIFVQGMQLDLQSVAETSLTDEGYKGYTFRLGIGATAGGDIGIAKGSGSLIGQINFSRDVPKPSTTFPKPPTHLIAKSLLMIENQPQASHLEFATQHLIPYSVERLSDDTETTDQAIYKIERERFRKGLSKAVDMASFFAKRGTDDPEAHWNVYELKVGFDFSITGSVGLVKVGGLATGEIAFFNQGF